MNLTSLLAGADRFFLLLSCAGQNAYHFVLSHDYELFSVELDFRAGVFAEKNPIAFLDIQGAHFAFFVDLAPANHHDFAFLWLILRGVRNDDPAASRFFLLDAPHQNPIVQWSQFHCHVVVLLEIKVSRLKMGRAAISEALPALAVAGQAAVLSPLGRCSAPPLARLSFALAVAFHHRTFRWIAVRAPRMAGTMNTPCTSQSQCPRTGDPSHPPTQPSATFPLGSQCPPGSGSA